MQSTYKVRREQFRAPLLWRFSQCSFRKRRSWDRREWILARYHSLPCLSVGSQAGFQRFAYRNPMHSEPLGLHSVPSDPPAGFPFIMACWNGATVPRPAQIFLLYMDMMGMCVWMQKVYVFHSTHVGVRGPLQASSPSPCLRKVSALYARLAGPWTCRDSLVSAPISL